MSPAMQSLLTLCAEHQPNRLEHAVGVALLAQAFGRMLQPGGADRQHVLGLAGLFHDIGELYIDPTYLRKGTPLDAAMWKHIVIPPLVADRVLRPIAGGDPAIADAVIHHHEAPDGFCYPSRK